ncbi:MAG: hypothetical protein C5B53_03580 [Candidatus Melainabacteria bacterium]|nr:MAG: hypothetical protein C5B53_03580 [Candidatus Melainabacteria bacterium]
MPVTRQEALNTLEKLGVAPIFVQSYFDERLPKNLDLFFRPPEELFNAPDTQQPYTEGRLIPLLDNGNFAFVLFYDPEDEGLIRKYIEHPEDEVRYSNWQQYLADLMIEIAENCDADDSELIEIAALLEFRHLEVTLAFLNSQSKSTYEQYESNKDKFIATI